MTHTTPEIASINRRIGNERRHADPHRIGADSVAGADQPKVERRKKQRRRQIDPTTCEREYTDDEIEFMQALDTYKRNNGRMFPTCSEVLEVIRSLGYTKLSADAVDATGADVHECETVADIAVD